MQMVFKIVGNFTDEKVNFDKILEKISKHFIFMYIKDGLFVAIKDFHFADESESFLRKTFKPSKFFYISEINEKNVSDQFEIIQEWCLSNFVRLETQKYEEVEQDKLKQVWKKMDALEEDLEKKLQEQQELQEQQDLLNRRLIAIYESGNTSYLQMLLTSADLSDFISKASKIPFMCATSRLVEQKGYDIASEAILQVVEKIKTVTKTVKDNVVKKVRHKRHKKA